MILSRAPGLKRFFSARPPQIDGFVSAGVAAGIKKAGSPKRDLALVCTADGRPADLAAGVFTQNRFPAAPINFTRGLLDAGTLPRGVVINAGCANACTGVPGERNAAEMARLAARATADGRPDAGDASFAVMSTGVIGGQLPMDRVAQGIERAAGALRADGWEDAAHAIMTTDTVPKLAREERDEGAVQVLGIAKGSGMIHPNMATMLAVLAVSAPGLHAGQASQFQAVLRDAVDQSFNCVTVDGDTSTNDCVVALARNSSGAASGASMASVSSAVTAACRQLAQMVARDGEGATKLMEIRVTGAESDAEARRVARFVGSSNLLKCAVNGGDANWGRIACALGNSGARFRRERVNLSLGGVPLMVNGEPLDPIDEAAATAAIRQDPVAIHLELGESTSTSGTAWSCDFSHEYVSINADYRS